MNVDKLSPTCVDNYINCFVTLINAYASLCLNFFSPTCSKAKFRKISIYSNKFFHNFHLSKSVLLVLGFGQVGKRKDCYATEIIDF